MGGGRARRAGRGGRGGWYRRGFVKTRRAQGLGLFFFFFFSFPFLPNQLKREKLEPFGSTLNFQWTRRRGQWAQPMPIKFTTTSPGGKKERKKIIFKFPSPIHTRTDARTHIRGHTKGSGGGGGGTGARGRRVGVNVCKTLVWGSVPAARALGEGAREARPDPSAMMVAAVRSPFSGGGAAMMQSPGPASRLRALLPAFS